MSEFKFACPICGQHITADSKDTGSKIQCPTCFRKIVVPQAPTDAESKFVISAREADKPRPPQPTIPELDPIEKTSQKTAIPIVLIALFVLVCGAGATVYALRGKIFHSKPGQPVADSGDSEGTGTQARTQNQAPPLLQYTGTNLWTLDLSNATLPETTLAGSLHHLAFTLDRATLTGSNLTLRVGHSGQVELGLSIYFFNRQAEELSGKAAEVKPADPTAPRVVIHWKDTDRHSETFHKGYAMKIEFGPAANNAIPGKLFISLPDDAQSWIAGTFRAEIHKPSPPKPKAPKPSQPQTQ